LSLTGATAAALAILAGRRLAVALGAESLPALQRAAATLGWATFGLFGASVGLIGGSLAPWPDSELLAYGPVLFGGLAAGALFAVAGSLLGGLAFGVEGSISSAVEAPSMTTGSPAAIARRPQPAK
jgi:hypothetical protein